MLTFSCWYYHPRTPQTLAGSQFTQPPSTSDEKLSKLDVAKGCLLTLLDQLKPTDSFGLVLFDHTVQVLQKLVKVSDLNMAQLKVEINKLVPKGGTNMKTGNYLLSHHCLYLVLFIYLFCIFVQIGFNAAWELYNALKKEYKQGKENRIMFLTDARPNSTDGIFSACKEAAASRIYTSFIGVGIDFGVKVSPFNLLCYFI